MVNCVKSDLSAQGEQKNSASLALQFENICLKNDDSYKLKSFIHENDLKIVSDTAIDSSSFSIYENNTTCEENLIYFIYNSLNKFLVNIANEEANYVLECDSSLFFDGSFRPMIGNTVENVGGHSECFTVSTLCNRNKQRSDYDVLLKSIENININLEIMDKEACSQSMQNTNVPQNDHVLDSMCLEVDTFVDQLMKEFDSNSLSAKGTISIQNNNRAHSLNDLEISDDVFVDTTVCKKNDTEILDQSSKEKTHKNFDINKIFHDGITPPIRPERKNKLKDRQRTLSSVSDVSRNADITRYVDQSNDAVPQSFCYNLEKITNTVSQFGESGITYEIPTQLPLPCPETCNTQNKNLSAQLNESSILNHEQHGTSVHSIADVRFSNSEERSSSADPNDCSSDVKNEEDISNEDSITESFDESHSCEEMSELLNTNYTKIARPISSFQFPPDTIDGINSIECNNLSSYSENISDEWYSNDDILGKKRKGSGSSDITAWKQELQRYGLFDLEDDWSENIMQSNKMESISFNSEDECISNDKEEEMVEDVSAKLREHDVIGQTHRQAHFIKSCSMIQMDLKIVDVQDKCSPITSRDWTPTCDGNMNVLKEGVLNRTKILESGKKLRKNWSPVYVVLTDIVLLFFKDSRAFSAMKRCSGVPGVVKDRARPELCIDLTGAVLSHEDKLSSRKNVFRVNSVLGIQVLLQCENTQLSEEWFHTIIATVRRLNGGSRTSFVEGNKQENPYPRPMYPEEHLKKSTSAIGIPKQGRVKNREFGSIEDLSWSPDEHQTKIKDRLKKFFHRRPTRESLMKKGIYKDEPMFGCHLSDVCNHEDSHIPRFVRLCVEAIESKEENMKTDGLYRVSANLSQVQKIRLQVDQNNLSVLQQEEDAHVLCGALKLFFRELKTPLIPFDVFDAALKASAYTNQKDKIKHFKEIVKSLPTPNRHTLEFLLRHLLKVTQFHSFNRMHISNLAIVFGPTLMWSEEETSNMAFDLMMQNLVIECLLQEFDSIFK